jgi:iron complex transport system permease protein
MLSSMASAAITALKYLADPNDTLPAITYWLMGSFSKVNTKGLLFSVVPIAVGCVVVFLFRWRLNVLTLGDEEAMSMGVGPPMTRTVTILASTVICSAAVCLGGQIGWVGLMVPHMARGMVGSDHRKMLPVAALTGGCFLLLMDNIARSVSTMELPIGVLTSFFGAPFFVLLLLKRKR